MSCWLMRLADPDVIAASDRLALFSSIRIAKGVVAVGAIRWDAIAEEDERSIALAARCLHEQCGAPSVQVLHSAVLALRRVGLDTGVVIDIGLGEPPIRTIIAGIWVAFFQARQEDRHDTANARRLGCILPRVPAARSLRAGTTRATPVLGGKVVEGAVQCQCFGAANITNMLLVRIPSQALLYILSQSLYSVTAREALMVALGCGAQSWLARPLLREGSADSGSDGRDAARRRSSGGTRARSRAWSASRASR